MSRKVKKFGMYFMLIVVSIISIFPIFWMVIASTNRSVDVIGGKLTVGTYLLENYKTLVSQQPIWGNFWNSCRYTVAVTVFALIISSLAGYGFEIYKDKRKKRYMHWYL